MYFVKGELSGTTPLPPDQWLPLVVKEWETMIRYAEQGKVVACGKLAGRRGECGIFDVDSPGELDDLVRNLPLFPFIDWEVIPLRAAEDALASVRETLEAITGRA